MSFSLDTSCWVKLSIYHLINSLHSRHSSVSVTEFHLCGLLGVASCRARERERDRYRERRRGVECQQWQLHWANIVVAFRSVSHKWFALWLRSNTNKTRDCLYCRAAGGGGCGWGRGLGLGLGLGLIAGPGHTMKTTLRQQKAARRELALSLVRDVYLSLCVCVCADNQRTTFGCRVGIVTGHGRNAVAAGVGGGRGPFFGQTSSLRVHFSYQHFGCAAAWHLCEFYVRLFSWLWCRRDCYTTHPQLTPSLWLSLSLASHPGGCSPLFRAQSKRCQLFFVPMPATPHRSSQSVA